MIVSHKLLRLALMTFMVACFTLLASFAAEQAVITVDTEQLNLRTGPSTESAVVDKLSRGALLLVELPEEGVETSWYSVIASEYGVGYVSADFVVETDQEEELLGVGRVTEGPLNVRAGAGTAHATLGQVGAGSRVNLVSYADGWYTIQYGSGEGFISAEYVALAWPLSQQASELGGQVVELAMQYIGYQYVSGGGSPARGFDCSGFTKYVYAQIGYSLYHGASSQMRNASTAVSKDALQPGDLVFFNSGNSRVLATHVGLYVGGGQFVHASTREYKVRTDTLMSGHYSNCYIGARRVI